MTGRFLNIIGFGKKLRILFVLTVAVLPLIACSRMGILPSATPLPLPTEMATSPLPPGVQPGDLDATFMSVVSADGAGNEQCYNLYRFYPDGWVLFTPNTCFNPTPAEEIWKDIGGWFHRENPDVASGDYYLDDYRLWLRVVSYDSVREIPYLRSFQGEYCEERMVLQEPAVLSYAGVPTNLTEPVVEYQRLWPLALGISSPADCHVAGFKSLFRSSVGLAGGETRYQIQTDPGETCFLQYIAPDGEISQVQGTGAITAGADGVCTWIWSVGEVKGDATVRVTVDEITQDYRMEIR